MRLSEISDVEAEGAVEIQDLELGRRLIGQLARREVSSEVITVTGAPAQLTDERGNVDHYVFSADWQTPNAKAVGELTRDLDYTQVLRLRADAIREVAGTDEAGVHAVEPGAAAGAMSIDISSRSIPSA